MYRLRELIGDRTPAQSWPRFITGGTLLAALLIVASAGALSAAQANNVVTVFGRQFQTQNAGTSYAFSSTATLAHFEVHPGDNFYSTDGRERSELLECPTRSRLLTEPLTASFTVRVDGNVVGDTDNDYTIFHQIHQDRIPTVEPDSTPKPPAMSFGFNDQGRFVIGVRGDTSVPTSDSTRSYTAAYSAPWTYGSQWVSMKYEARFGPTGDGALKVWINGELVVDRAGLNFGYTGSSTANRPQPKFGIYRSAIPSALNVDYSDITIANPKGKACR